MAVKAKQQYYADETTIKKEAREFGMIDELKDKLDSIEYGAQVNIIEEVQENGVPLEIVDKSVNVLVPEVIDNLYTIDPNNSLSAKQGKILYDMIKNLLARGRFLSTWNTATGLPVTNPEESPYEYKAGDYYIVGIVAAEGGTNFRPEPGEYVINVASDEQETSEVHVSDIYVYDGENWILLINSTREIAVDDYVDHTYQSTNPVENQAIAREIDTKQNKFYTVSTTSPSNPAEGDEWYDATNDKVFYWDGTQWKEMGGGGSTYTAGLHISIDPNDNNKISVVEWSATSSALGLVKLGSDTRQTTTPNSVTSTANRTYRIQTNSSGQLLVNVPWTDTNTTYTQGEGININNENVISCTVKPVQVGPTYQGTPSTGCLWYDTTKNTMFLYKNNAWTIIGPEIYPITKADYEALTPAEQGDGRFFLITDNDGTIYVDWENIENRVVYTGSTAPANPCNGYIWLDTSDFTLYGYNSTLNDWEPIGGGGGGTYTAGDGIDIDANNEISVDVTDIIGTGLSEDASNNIIVDTTVVATQTDLSNKQDKATSGSGAPATTPAYVGQVYIDTTNDNMYVATGTSSSSDWTAVDTNTTYTAGDGIDITNNEISVDASDLAGTGLSTDNNNNLIVDTTTIQEKLVSGTNIKTVNNTSLLGNGNIDIPSGKNDIVTSTTAPSDHTVLWIKDNSGISGTNELYYYDNKEGEWVKFNGVYEGDTAPEYFNLWYDTNDWTLKVSDARTSNQFSPICLISYGSSSAPGATLWYYRDDDTGDSRLKYYDEDTSEWQDIRGPYIDSSAPYDTDFGEMGGLWVDTSGTYPVLKYYDTENSQWKPVGGVEYTAGTGIDITNGEISVDTSVIQEKLTAGDGIDIDANNEISVDVTDIIGTGLSEDANNNLIVDSTVVALKSDLTNYYTKTETYTKTEVDNLISSFGNFEVVASLPPVSTASEKTIYLLGPIGTGADKYEEWIVTEDSQQQKQWTKIGETSVDLSGYATTTALTNGLATKQDTLTAGDGIDIDANDEISVDVTDIIGTGLSEDANNNIIVDTTVIQGKLTAGTNIDITNDIISSDTQFVLVDTLPSISTADENKIYILGPIGTGADKYEEWIKKVSQGQGGGVMYWVKIGETSVDISGKQDKATSGSTAPSTTPSYVGEMYVDTTNDILYVATGTSSSSDWTEVGAGSGDMLYSDFGWETLTGATVTLALRGEITPSANFTVNKPNDLKDGQFYVLRVGNGATAYTMTLGTGVTNPYSEDLTLVANNIQQFMFLAKGGNLELQPSTEIDISGKQDKATSGSAAPSTTPSYIGQQYVDTTNNILYVATGTSSSSDWIVAGKTYTAGNGIDITNDVISADLAAGTGINISNQTCTTESDRKGPCPSGFHVPSHQELSDVSTLYYNMFQGGIISSANIMGDLKAPGVGTRAGDAPTPLIHNGGDAYWWTSNPVGTSANAEYGVLGRNAAQINIYWNSPRCEGMQIRPFRNATVEPTSSWTVIQGTLGNVGIFWNQTDGLISIGQWSSNVWSGVTIADKNLGATTVWNYEDTATDANSGKFYQWGNNYGFIGVSDTQGTTITTTTTQVDASSYGPGNYYSHNEFYKNMGAGSDWSSVENDDLWGYTSNSTHQECITTTTLTISSSVDISGKQDKATSGSTAPATTPTYVGQQYVDTTNDILYVATGTSSSSDWTEVGAGSGDMLYADFNWVTKTGATVTLDLNSTITPSDNFTVNAPSTIKDGQVYILRVVNGATAYTMTLGTGITNPYSTSTTLTANGVDQFVFQAIGGNLELLPDTDVDITGKQDKATSSSTAPAITPSYIGQQHVDTTNDKLYVATGTSSSSDWMEVGAGGGNVIAMTQQEYNALTTAEKNDGKLRIITDAPTEDISIEWSNIANRPGDLTAAQIQAGSSTTSGMVAPSVIAASMPILSTQTGALSSVKIWVGTQSAYEALATKDANTLYFTTPSS